MRSGDRNDSQLSPKRNIHAAKQLAAGEVFACTEGEEVNIGELRDAGNACVIDIEPVRCPCQQPAVGFGLVRASSTYVPICAKHNQDLLELGEMTEDDFVTLREEAACLMRYQNRGTCERCITIEVGH